MDDSSSYDSSALDGESSSDSYSYNVNMDNSDSSSNSSTRQSSSDSYLYDSDGSYQYSHLIGNVRYSKKAFKKILYSNEPKDKEKAKSMIIDCIKEDNYEALESLLSWNKLSIDKVLIEDKGQTALHLAYYYNVSGLVELILDNMSTSESNSTDCYGLTHFHVGCWAENEDLIKKCLENGADVNACFSRTDSKGKEVSGITSLHLLCIFGSIAFLENVKLLLDNGADVNAVDSLGRSALHLACRVFGFPDNGNDPKHTFENVEIMKVLLDHGCDVNKSDINGNTPLLSIYRESYALQNKFYPRWVPFAESVEKLKLMLERGADATVRNNHGDTVLHRLIRMLLTSNYLLPGEFYSYSFDPVRHVKMVEMILETKQPININAANSLGETPLQLAVSLMSANIVKVLLDHGADLSCLNFNENDEYCFSYSYELPKLEQVYNVVNIMEMLSDKELKLTLKDNLTILKFLVHDVNNCECANVSFSDDFDNSYRYDGIQNKLRQLLAFSSSKHFTYILKKILRSLSSIKLINEKEQTLGYIKELFHYNSIAAFYMEKDIVDLIKKISIEYSINEHQLARLEKEVACMKTIKLAEDITLYDIIIKHPHDIYQYTKNINIYNLEVSSKFNIYKYMIEGHIAKSLIRHYVEKSAYDYLTELSLSILPDLCMQEILHYLSNEDILNLCLSALCENEN